MFSSVVARVRGVLVAVVSFSFVACANTDSDPRPLQRESSAQTDGSGVVCETTMFAMSHCAFSQRASLEEARCESGERILHIYFQFGGNINGDPLTAGNGQFVARLTYDDDRFSYAAVQDIFYDRVTDFTFGFVPTYSFCAIETDALVEPKVLELGFRSDKTRTIVPLAALDILQTPEVILHDVEDCSPSESVELTPSPPVTWHERNAMCWDQLIWPDDIQWPSEPEDWPEEGASYRSLPMRAVGDGEDFALEACNEGDSVEYVQFESSDTRLRHFLIYLLDHIRETALEDPEQPDYDVLLGTVVDVVDTNGTLYRGDAVISARDEIRATRRQGSKGSVPVDRFTWRWGAPPSDQYVSLQQFYIGVPSLYTGETWTFNMPGEPIWVMWPQAEAASFEP